MLPYIANLNVRKIKVTEIEIFAISETKYSPNSKPMTFWKLMDAKLSTFKEYRQNF